MRLRLRTFLTAAFFVVSTIPLGIWAVWTSQTALQREIDEVEDRHLLLARNISAALSRYAVDTAAAFELAVSTPINERGRKELSKLLKSLHFNHVCLVDVQTGSVSSLVTAGRLSTISKQMVTDLAEIGRTSPGNTVFAPVRRNAWNEPTIYLVRTLGDQTAAVGELSTDYFRATQQAVVFGEKGHAAIVDSLGRVIGHPRADWVDEIKNISKVEPVRRMMAGETGVSRFYSPALMADMIAGYTAVPRTGWGVMIPQPFSEIESRANEVRTVAIGMLIAGAALSAALGWFVAGFIASPLQKAVRSANQLAEGDFDVRPIESRGVVPSEVAQLADAFDAMANDLRTLNENRQQALKSAIESAEAKSDFVARVSHELRTPLNSVIGFSGMIKAEAHGPIAQGEYRDYSVHIHEAGQQLLMTIENILSYARADGHGEALEESEIDIVETCKVVLTAHRSRADENRIVLDLQSDLNTPLLLADETKIRQILAHLVSNAIKFSQPDGTVVITLGLTEAGDLSISVADTGIGIAADQIPLALQPFGQIENGFARKYEGTGLGLPLAQMLTELHGGTLSIDSVEGRGTTVTMQFPASRLRTFDRGGADET